MPSNDFEEHCRQIAKRFLLTAVVVDDELSVVASPNVHGDLTPPGSSPLEPTSVPREPQVDSSSRPLGVHAITSSFARHGMVCGVVSPPSEPDGTEGLARAAARADILILDWRLSRETGENSLPLLQQVLRNDQTHRLRLVAFYTGQPQLERIRQEIVEGLGELSGPYDAETIGNGDCRSIDFGPCRIVVYSKRDPDVSGPRSAVTEAELPDRLVADFADRVTGLLPSLVLTALTAVRENVYRILDRFESELDPAFLAHRACLPVPQDSQGHIVEQVASELRGLMDDAVSSTRPAGIGAIKRWLVDRFEDRNVVFVPDRKEMSMAEIEDLLTHGIEEKRGPLKKEGKEYHLLSYGFSDGAENSRALDQRLASAMSFREVVDGGTRQLSIGTVVRVVDSGHDTTLLCVTPACDSVRLKGPSSFLFIPLEEPPKSNTLQLIVPSDESEYKQMTICMNPSRWRTATFESDAESQCVLSSTDAENLCPVFKDRSDRLYHWIGELKAESAQSVAQAIAERMSRMPLNKSEWLRRSERVGELPRDPSSTDEMRGETR